MPTYYQKLYGQPISSYFRFYEFFVSKKHPDQIAGLTVTEIDKMKITYLVKSILDPLRKHFQVPVIITSGKRSEKLNELVGGSKTSDHLYYQDSCCCDFTVNGNPELTEKAFTWIQEKLPYSFGQLILYKTWDDQPSHIHVSLPTLRHSQEVFECNKNKVLVRLNRSLQNENIISSLK